MTTLNCAGKIIDLSVPNVMGILNVTPDSFSDGGQYVDLHSAVAQAEIMVEQGATIIDIGGESTRPGAQPVSADEECKRVIPIIEALQKRQLAAVISIDTSKAQVMQYAVESGAGFINDVCALQQGNAIGVAAELDVPICLMHMQGEPRSMQHDPSYNDVVKDVSFFLQERVDSCLAAGIKKENLLIDPGFGFGKTVSQNYILLDRLAEFKKTGLPVLVGLSRKSMIGAVLEKQVGGRLAGSVAAAALALDRGVSILRVHDVAESVDAVKVFCAMQDVRKS